MIASRVSVRRWWWFALLLAAVTTFLPSLASMLERPRWQLRISKVRSTCFGPAIRGDFRIASTGEVTWTRGPGWPVRRLALSSEQLALARRLDRLAHAEPPSGDTDFLIIRTELAEGGGAHLSLDSKLGAAVTAMLDELMARQLQLELSSRQAALASMDLQLETTGPGAVYRVRVTGGRITVDRGRTRRLDEPMPPALLINLVDAALDPRAAGDPDEGADELGVDEPDVTGSLHLQGRSIPLALWRHRRGAST